MIILDRLLVGSLLFVLDKVAAAVEQELEDDDRRALEDLLAAQMRFELGELTEAEFRAQEAALLERMRAARERRGATAGPVELAPGEGERIEASVEIDWEEPRARARPVRRRKRRSR